MPSVAVYPSLLPHVQRQPDAAATVCAGLQPSELLAAVGTASRCRALVPDDATGKAGEDRCQGNPARQVRHVPTRRGSGDAELVRRDPRPHCAARAAATAGRRVRHVIFAGDTRRRLRRKSAQGDHFADGKRRVSHPSPVPSTRRTKKWRRITTRRHGGAMLNWGAFHAWNGFRLNPNGKCRISDASAVLEN